MFSKLSAGMFIQKLELQRKAIVIQPEWPESLKKLLKQSLPSPDSPIDELNYLCFDYETTGVDVRKDSILSMGFIHLHHKQIELESAQHHYINAKQRIQPSSAVVNHILSEDLYDGIALDNAMDLLFQNMLGKVLLVHGACIEKAFTEYYLKKRFGLSKFPIIWLDTLQIEKKLIYRYSTVNSYQLNDLRENYRLPDYPGHNALNDALSTAELYLAQVNKLFCHSNYQPLLKTLFRTEVY